MLNLSDLYTGFGDIPAVLIGLAIMLFTGFLLTRPAKLLHLPYASAYIIAGVLIGPRVLGLIPHSMIGHMGFISDIAIAFIAFDVGRYFKSGIPRGNRGRVTVIALFETLLPAALVTLFMVICGFSLPFSLLFGTIAAVTAPTSTMVTIRQSGAEGSFVSTLIQVIGLDNAISLLMFSIASAVLESVTAGDFRLLPVLLPILYNLAALAIAVFFGWFLSHLITPVRSRDNRLILVIAMLCTLSGFCSVVDISPLLSCMAFGIAYINLTADDALYRQIHHFTPPVLSIFFILSGMTLDLGAALAVSGIGIGYFLVRMVGKYFGAWIGALATKSNAKIRRYMGMALMPQASVAIALAVLGSRLLPEEQGQLLHSVILSAAVLYELVGPLCAKAALSLSGSLPKVPEASSALDNVEKEVYNKE